MEERKLRIEKTVIYDIVDEKGNKVNKYRTFFDMEESELNRET